MDFVHHQIFQVEPLTTPYVYHNFDSTLGFPIYIPKVYDRRNKSFLFLGYRIDVDKETDLAQSSVLTPGMLGEDPSNPGYYEFNWAGAQPIYDPIPLPARAGPGLPAREALGRPRSSQTMRFPPAASIQ